MGLSGLSFPTRSAHQKPVLLQKGRRGRSVRAASTSTRCGASARARGAASSAASSASSGARGRAGRMAERGGAGWSARSPQAQRVPCPPGAQVCAAPADSASGSHAT